MFLSKTGVIVSKEAWLASLVDVIAGHAVLVLDGDAISVFTRFSGLDHGGYKAWELGVTGNPKNAKHVSLHGRHELYSTQAEAETAHVNAVADVKSAGGVSPLLGP